MEDSQWEGSREKSLVDHDEKLGEILNLNSKNKRIGEVRQSNK